MKAPWLALLSALLALSCLCLLPFLGGHEPLEVGTTAPPFELASVAGKTISLTDFEGRPVLLNFWTST